MNKFLVDDIKFGSLLYNHPKNKMAAISENSASQQPQPHWRDEGN